MSEQRINQLCMCNNFKSSLLTLTKLYMKNIEGKNKKQIKVNSVDLDILLSHVLELVEKQKPN